jgi:cellulose synthase/poly-beta-1,6-N-acetylglucosamine synthase-like glycosyltransferase
MAWQDYLCLAVLVLWLLAAAQGMGAFWRGLRFYQHVRDAVARAGELRDASGRFKYQPKATVILPCCGLDEKLEQTIQSLGRQRYDDYEVIFAFESERDAAYEAVGRWIQGWTSPRCRRVIAGLAERRAQKVHNLLAAVEAASDDREVLVFLDSDAIPREDWLGYMVAPLGDVSVGASTGYRWYTATGGFAAGVRGVWNAATVTSLDDERLNFCWGGATAIGRGMFESIGVRRRWENSVTDDLALTVAARQAGLKIRFVPQALIPSSDGTTLKAFWAFARRQLIITRVYTPEIWKAGFVLCLSLVVGGTAAAALFFASALGLLGGESVTIAALAGWIGILALAGGKAILPQLAVRKVLPRPDWTWRDFWWDVAGVGFSGPLHLALLVASLMSRRFVWRNTVYEVRSPDETRVLGRITALAT